MRLDNQLITLPTLSSHTHLQAAQNSAQPKLANKYACPTVRTERKALAITAPLRYGGGSGIINSSAINKQCAFRQVSASNPPQRKAANRYTANRDRDTQGLVHCAAITEQSEPVVARAEGTRPNNFNNKGIALPKTLKIPP